MNFNLWDIEGQVGIEVEADDWREARNEARDWARGGDWNFQPGDESIWVKVAITPLDDDGEELEDDAEEISVQVDPPEPECPSGDDHRWESPYELLGGLKENPGVQGHGGGVVICEVCVRCGCQKTTDTWAQNMATGEQGLTSVSYQEDAYDIETFLADTGVDEIAGLPEDYAEGDGWTVKVYQAYDPFEEWYAVVTETEATETRWIQGREEAMEAAEEAAQYRRDQEDPNDED